MCHGVGDRRDYKFWAAPALLGLMNMETKVEVCYCESSCDNSFNYFKAIIYISIYILKSCK